MTAALRVLSPGLMTTLQDLGRPGFQRLGIPVSGALDPISLRAANLIVGNPAATAALEIAYQGPMLAVEADSVRVALAGAGAPLDILDETGAAERVPPLASVRLQRGQRLRIGALAGGAVAYLAVEGGFAVEPMLGSRSTYVRAGIGGFAGRAVAGGDLLPLASDAAAEREEQRHSGQLQKICHRSVLVIPSAENIGTRFFADPLPSVPRGPVPFHGTDPAKAGLGPGFRTRSWE